jgi:hypothetical protein
LVFLIKVLKETFQYIFIIFIFIEDLLSFSLIVFKYFSINNIYKVEFKLDKGFFFKKKGHIYNLFSINLGVYLVKTSVDLDLG